jgi:hypothetical protein
MLKQFLVGEICFNECSIQLLRNNKRKQMSLPRCQLDLTPMLKSVSIVLDRVGDDSKSSRIGANVEIQSFSRCFGSRKIDSFQSFLLTYRKLISYQLRSRAEYLSPR